MRISKARAAIGAAAAALVAGVGGAAATTLPASGAAATHTVKFTAARIGHDHQTGKFSFVSSEVERRQGHVIGTDSVTGKFDVKKGVAHLFVAVAWKGGAVIVRGRALQNGDFAGTVVRGTGKYAGIKGTVVGHSVPHSNKTRITVTYTL